MKNIILIIFLILAMQHETLGQVEGHRSGQGRISNFQEIAQQYGFEEIKRGKFGLVVSGVQFTYHQALTSCETIFPGVTLFNVNDEKDSFWLGVRINREKDYLTGASKFWVGLNSQRANGPLIWRDGNPYQSYPEVVQVSGFDDSSKTVAWAVPDGGSRMKYEFLTTQDEAEAFVCQF